MTPLPQPEKRKPLTKWQFANLFLQQGGRCKVCNCKLEPGKTRDEHVQALDHLGSNDLSNRELWCLACTKPKDAADKKASAKGRRLRGETGQIARRARNGPTLKSNQKKTWPKRSLSTPEGLKFDWKLKRYRKETI